MIASITSGRVRPSISVVSRPLRGAEGGWNETGTLLSQYYLKDLSQPYRIPPGNDLVCTTAEFPDNQCPATGALGILIQ